MSSSSFYIFVFFVLLCIAFIVDYQDNNPNQVKVIYKLEREVDGLEIKIPIEVDSVKVLTKYSVTYYLGCVKYLQNKGELNTIGE